jgi:hypothetical protein
VVFAAVFAAVVLSLPTNRSLAQARRVLILVIDLFLQVHPCINCGEL